ncbi:MAG: HAMP domain-containing protein, partial [Chloroflexota bacterium]
MLALTSAGAGVVWIIQGYRSRLAIDHLSDLAIVASLTARQLERQDARPEEIGAFVDNQLVSAQTQDVRILVLDSDGWVLVERPALPGQEPLFVGHQLEMPTPSSLPYVSRDRRTFLVSRTTIWTSSTGPLHRPFILVTAGGPAPAPPPDLRPDAVERFLARQPAYRIALAVPQHNLAAAWRELLPGLGVAAAIALAASVAAAFWLSRSITRPLRQITRAADGIARGDLRQQIPVRGSDEVAQLARSFNSMSQ